MRSTSCSVACWTIASPIERARTVRAADDDAVVLAEQARLLERLHCTLLLGRVGRVVEALRQRHAHDVERLDVGAALLGELHGGRDHLLADQPELHRHEDLRQRRLRKLRLLVGRDHALQEPLAAVPPDEAVDDEPRRQPDRPRVAGAGVRDHRDDPDGERQHEPDDRRNRDIRAGDADIPGHAIWPLERRGREPEPYDGELRGAECEQDAEAEERRQEGDLVVGYGRDRDQAARGEDDDRRERRGRDECAPAQPAERARQHPVLAERIREAPEPGHGCRRGGQEDERARDADEDP